MTRATRRARFSGKGCCHVFCFHVVLLAVDPPLPRRCVSPPSVECRPFCLCHNIVQHVPSFCRMLQLAIASRAPTWHGSHACQSTTLSGCGPRCGDAASCCGVSNSYSSALASVLPSCPETRGSRRAGVKHLQCRETPIIEFHVLAQRGSGEQLRTDEGGRRYVGRREIEEGLDLQDVRSLRRETGKAKWVNRRWAQKIVESGCSEGGSIKVNAFHSSQSSSEKMPWE